MIPIHFLFLHKLYPYLRDLYVLSSIEFAEKEKTNLDLCRRTLDQLVNKKLVEKDKVSGKKAIENQYRLRLRQ